MEKTYPARL